MGLENISQTEYVVWNFGDGSDEVTVYITEDNSDGSTDHLFTEKGNYIVTATQHNTHTSETGETTEGELQWVYLYHIMGFPVVTFESNGGSAVDKIEGTSSEYVPQKPADPMKEGSVFKGWFTDSDCTVAFNWGSKVAAHTTLYACWEKIVYTVDFDLYGGEGSIEAQTIEYGGTVKEPAAPVRDEHIFTGWYLNGTEYKFTSPVYSNISLVAGWELKAADKTYYDVKFDADGGISDKSSMNVQEKYLIALPDAIKDGYDLEGWYLDDVKVGNAGDMYTVTSNVTLKAHWTVTAPDHGDDSKKDTNNGMAIIFAIAAVLCIIALLITGMTFLGIPAAILAILAALFGLGVL